jgi:hypothetical protein
VKQYSRRFKEMTLVDLNPVEINLIIDLLKFNIDDLSLGSPNRRIPEQILKEWKNQIQSLIYKLEKAVEI